MEIMKNILVPTGIAVLAVVLGFVFFTPKPEQPLGAVPVLSSPTEINGITTYYESRTLNQASTTICSIKSPAATSTLVMGSVKLTTGTTTAIALELAKATTYAATTTRLSYVTLASGAQVTLDAFVASTTGVYGSLGQQHTADETDLIFAPGAYLNAKYGGALGSLNTLVGTCKAKFIVN